MSKNSTYEIRVQASKNSKPQEWQEARMSYEGERYVTMVYQDKPTKTHVRRIDANTYEVLKTGEIRKYDRMSETSKRQSKRAALNRTFTELRGMIRTNFVSSDQDGYNEQLFVTLTYKDNMTDSKQLYKDFMNFIDRLVYAYPDYNFEYIAVMEPQGRGAWHVHLMLKAPGSNWLWIDKAEMSRIWGDVNIRNQCDKEDKPYPKKYRPIEGHGYTTTARLKSDDVGAYYTAYFTGILSECMNDDDADQELTGEEIAQEEEFLSVSERLFGAAETLKKSHLKGQRLKLYPKGFRLYRCSRGVDRPEKHKQFVHEIESDDSYKRIYDQAYVIDKIMTSGENEGEIIRQNMIYKATYRKEK